MESISDQSIREYLAVVVHNAMLKDSANVKQVDKSLEMSIESSVDALFDNRSLKNAVWIAIHSKSLEPFDKSIVKIVILDFYLHSFLSSAHF